MVGTGGVAQLVEHLSRRHETLCSSSFYNSKWKERCGAQEISLMLEGMENGAGTLEELALSYEAKHTLTKAFNNLSLDKRVQNFTSQNIVSIFTVYKYYVNTSIAAYNDRLILRSSRPTSLDVIIRMCFTKRI
jgi:hypothetical protein